MSAPALQQKKKDRDARLQKASVTAAATASADAASFEKAITDRAKAYEAEYNLVISIMMRVFICKQVQFVQCKIKWIDGLYFLNYSCRPPKLFLFIFPSQR